MRELQTMGAPKVLVPDQKALQAAVEVSANRAETIKYLIKQVLVRFNLAKIDITSPEVKSLLKTLDKHLGIAEATDPQSQSSASSWQGLEELSSAFAKTQAYFSDKAVTDITAENISGEVQMDYAISDEADIMRAYAIDGKQIASESILIDSFDNLFNDWLAQPKLDDQKSPYTLFSVDGSIYKAGEDGTPLLDDQKNFISADAQEVRRLMGDKKEGFKQYVQERIKELQMVIQERAYPQVEADTTEAPEPTTPKTQGKQSAQPAPRTDTGPSGRGL